MTLTLPIATPFARRDEGEKFLPMRRAVIDRKGFVDRWGVPVTDAAFFIAESISHNNLPRFGYE